MFRVAIISDIENTVIKKREEIIKAIGDDDTTLVSPIIKSRYDVKGYEGYEVFATHVSIGNKNENDMQLSVFAEMDLFGVPSDEDGVEKYIDAWNRFNGEASLCYQSLKKKGEI